MFSCFHVFMGILCLDLLLSREASLGTSVNFPPVKGILRTMSFADMSSAFWDCVAHETFDKDARELT